MTNFDDEQVRVTERPDGTALIWLPSVEYLDTIAYSAEIAIDREHAEQLRNALDQWLIRKDYPMQGCNTSMACVMRNGCRRCQPPTEDHSDRP